MSLRRWRHRCRARWCRARRRCRARWRRTRCWLVTGAAILVGVLVEDPARLAIWLLRIEAAEVVAKVFAEPFEVDLPRLDELVVAHHGDRLALACVIEADLRIGDRDRLRPILDRHRLALRVVGLRAVLRLLQHRRIVRRKTQPTLRPLVLSLLLVAARKRQHPGGEDGN